MTVTDTTGGRRVTAHDSALVARVAHRMDPDVFAQTTPQHLAAQAATVQDAHAILDLLAGEGRLVDPAARRVVLVTPGDVLLVGGLDPATAHATGRVVTEWFAALGIPVAFHAGGVTINLDPGAALDGGRT